MAVQLSILAVTLALANVAQMVRHYFLQILAFTLAAFSVTLAQTPVAGPGPAGFDPGAVVEGSLGTPVPGAAPLIGLTPGSVGSGLGPNLGRGLNSGLPPVLVNPYSLAAPVSNVALATDVIPIVNVAPTIPIPYTVPVDSPYPVSVGYPVPIPFDVSVPSYRQFFSGGVSTFGGGFNSFDRFRLDDFDSIDTLGGFRGFSGCGFSTL